MAADRAMPAAFYEEKIRLLEAERQQAIDALREIAQIEDSFQAKSRNTGTVATCFHDCPALARAALLSLGEHP